MRYRIISSDYQQSDKIKKMLVDVLVTHTYDKLSPEVVFVIGGDGTFLHAVDSYKNKIDQIIFVPIKSGGVGFYTNGNKIDDLIENIKINLLSSSPHIKELALLEMKIGNHSIYGINEIKLTSPDQPGICDIYINNEHLETFKGTGLIFATPSGSSGIMKSSGGAIIYPHLDLFEMNELLPVSTNKFRTTNSPIIFSKEQIIFIVLHGHGDWYISADTYPHHNIGKKIQVKLSDKKVKVLELNDQQWNKTKIIKNIFVLNDENKD